MPSGVYKRTEEMKQKMRENAISRGYRPPSRLGIPVSLEQRLKISTNLKGKPKNPEVVKRSAETNKARGHKRSVEFCENRRKVMTGKYVGENSPSWKGGITPYYRVMRVARLKAVGGSHTTAEWETLQAQYNWTCPCCKKSEVKLTKDHIIPVIKGGSDNIENIQPLCGSCNSKKHIKVIKYDYNIINLNEK